MEQIGTKDAAGQLDVLTRSLDSIDEAILITDCHQKDINGESDPIVYANKAFERLTGYSKDEVLGRNCKFLQGEETSKQAVETLAEHIHEREPVAVEMQNYRKDGTPFLNHFSVHPVADHTGKVTHMIAVEVEAKK